MVRYLTPYLNDFTLSKFLLIAGPRQTGKTTLVKAWLEEHHGTYLNWDSIQDRKGILNLDFIPAISPPQPVVLDELHKYRRWKSYLKGLYDKHHQLLRLIVTGSARLDIYQRGQDSLLGRHEYLRLHPFSVGELTHGIGVPPPTDWTTPGSHEVRADTWQRLSRRSGFPEPYTIDENSQHQRWQNRRRSLLISDDLREISAVRELSQIEHLALLLPERVASLLSLNALREELQVSHESISLWMELFDRLYYCYRVKAFSEKLNRTLSKTTKLYLWDWSEVQDPGSRFENMVASHLLKAVQFWNDVGFGLFDLFYLKTRDNEEIDFVVTNRRKPIALFECKVSDGNPSRFVKFAAGRFAEQVARIQLVENLSEDFKRGNLLVTQADRYLCNLV